MPGLLPSSPVVGDTEELRLASRQAQHLHQDMDGLVGIIEEMLSGRPESPDQAVINALGILADMRASIDQTYHSLACTVLNEYLRDNPIIYDPVGRPLKYHGHNEGGISVGFDYQGASHITLRVIDIFVGGFSAAINGESPLRFTYSRP